MLLAHLAAEFQWVRGVVVGLGFQEFGGLLIQHLRRISRRKRRLDNLDLPNRLLTLRLGPPFLLPTFLGMHVHLEVPT